MMEKNNTNDTMQEKVLAAIAEQRVAMRPKLYFTAKIMLLAVVAVVVLVLSIAIVNFMLFGIRLNSHETLLGFGPRGFWLFFLRFPWALLIFDIGAIALLSYLMRQFRFGYRTPFIYILLALAVTSAALGFVVDRGTPFNDQLYEQARVQRLPPPFAGIYSGMRREWDEREGMCHCTVLSIDDDTLIVADVRDADTQYTVVFPPDEAFATTSGVSVGDTVLIAGDVDESGVIHAFGLRAAPPRGAGKVPVDVLLTP